MITKAIINSLPVEGDNLYRVRVPLFEDNNAEEAIMDALACNSSETHNAYKVNDVVWLGFEDEKMNMGVILGRLNKVEYNEDNTVYDIMNELKVTGKAILPADTYIGNYCAQDIFELQNAASNSSSGGGFTYKLVRIWEDINE